MATYNARYVDPDTGGWVKTAYKDFARTSASLGWVYGMLMTERGSIEEVPWFGSQLRFIKHITPGVCAQIEAAIDEALRPYVGQYYDSYTRKAWLQNGAPLFTVEISVAGSTGVLEVPMTVE